MLIISIDGGGIRGLVPAEILANVEARIGKLIGQVVDMAAGTSTGGIIAAAIGAGIPMTLVKQLYREQGAQIFSRSAAQEIASMGGLTNAKYSPKGLEECLAKLFLDRRLSETGPAEILITAVDLFRRPFFFKSHKAKASPADDYLLTQVTRSTAAAPGFFPVAEIKDQAGVATRYLRDGGLAANDPALCAIAEALKLGHRLEDISVISLGTGADESVTTVKIAEHCGLLNDGLDIVDTVFNATAAAEDYKCRNILRDRYVRLQPVLPKSMAMDATDEATMATLEGVAVQICDSPEFECALKVLTS